MRLRLTCISEAKMSYEGKLKTTHMEGAGNGTSLYTLS